jgi:hypothetical protein
MAMLPVSAPTTAPPVLPEQAPLAGPARRGRPGVTRLIRAVRSNRKATTGATLLALFTLVALFPGLIAHDDPAATIYNRSLGPSARPLPCSTMPSTKSGTQRCGQ